MITQKQTLNIAFIEENEIYQLGIKELLIHEPFTVEVFASLAELNRSRSNTKIFDVLAIQIYSTQSVGDINRIIKKLKNMYANASVIVYYSQYEHDVFLYWGTLIVNGFFSMNDPSTEISRVITAATADNVIYSIDTLKNYFNSVSAAVNPRPFVIGGAKRQVITTRFPNPQLANKLVKMDLNTRMEEARYNHNSLKD